jgi:hypothetical protein
MKNSIYNKQPYNKYSHISHIYLLSIGYNPNLNYKFFNKYRYH